MDEIDIQIIEILQLEGRISISDLSKRIALSRPSVNERVQRLQEKGVIRGYKAIVHPESVGRNLLVMIELINLRVPMNKFEEHIKNNVPQVIECHRATGHVHYYIKAALKGTDELTDLIKDLLPFGDTRSSILLGTPVENNIILP
ncbi:MAG TPA: Lrp/AsnC family transcriptional regulator [Pseudogracilibacillus sp.]|nr:Lrp/AsnC family transcriptional regulator [Pseudogracilibacillus sp.]